MEVTKKNYFQALQLSQKESVIICIRKDYFFIEWNHLYVGSKDRGQCEVVITIDIPFI